MLPYNHRPLFLQTLAYAPAEPNLPTKGYYETNLQILREKIAEDSYMYTNQTETENQVETLNVPPEKVLSQFQHQGLKGRLYKE